MERPFSYSIYQKGKSLYQNMKVSSVLFNGSIAEGKVMDYKLHKVKLVFDSGRQLSAKYCDCTYAKVYHECQHMAALYIRIMNEGVQTSKDETFRDLYTAYISSKAKPKIKDYTDFEAKLLHRLTVMAKENAWLKIKAYCEELPRITYPSNRINILVHQLVRALNTLIKNETFQKEIFQWGIDSLSMNKNWYFHAYFLNLIQKKTSIEIQGICEELLNQIPVVLNEALCTNLLLLLERNTQLSFDEFIQKYDRFKNTEAMVYLSAQNLMSKEAYEQAARLLRPYQNSSKKGMLYKEMKNLYDKAQLLSNPLGSIERMISSLSYWDPDLSELAVAKELLSDEWPDLRNNVYDFLSKKIDSYSFERFICQQDEWEYAVHLLYNEPSIDHLKAFEKLIEEHDPEMIYELILEALMKIADNETEVIAYRIIADYLKGCIENAKESERIEYILYYLKKLNPDKEKLIELLDDVMEDEYEA